jgi:hypothetical protein
MEAGLTVREYEALVLSWLRHHLTEEHKRLRGEGWMIQVEDVRLDVSERERMLVILFRDDARPQCLFGWRFPSMIPRRPIRRPGVLGARSRRRYGRTRSS